jgi:hypothetical protein
MPYSQITVEFIGLSRILTHQHKLALKIDPGTSYRDIISIIAKKYPSMVGQVITPDGKELYGSNMISLNGKHMINEDEIGNSPHDGDRIIFMSILAGG